MELMRTDLADVIVIKPTVFEDSRGFFMESWSQKSFEEVGLYYRFVQDNHSYSKRKGTLRGIHLQTGRYAQAKLTRCIRGTVLDVAVDLRPNSPTYREWVAVELSQDNMYQLLIPRGFGHGFVTMTDNVEFMYKVDRAYCPSAECTIRWDDPQLSIDWGVCSPILSAKDMDAVYLFEVEGQLRCPV